MNKYLFAIIALLLTIVFMVSCVGNPTTTPGSSDIKDVLITLERTACKGKCPVYTLSIYGNGTVVYEGKDYVKVQGRQTTAISEDQVRQLIAEFQKVDYFALEDSYEEFMATDMPSTYTSLTVGGKTKTVRHYHGDFSAPEELTALEDRIDDIVNSDQWVR